MCKRSIALVAVIALGTLVSLQAVAQTANRAPAKKIFGFQDSKTGAFHPLGNSAEIADPAATTTTFTGTIEVTIVITLKTALATGGQVACTLEADATSSGSSGEVGYVESATHLATVAGSTATCKVNVPFSWLLFTATTTQINSLTATLDVFMYSPVTTSITGLTLDLSREHVQALVINSGKVADGILTTATTTVPVTM
jgi:hypothetical protein